MGNSPGDNEASLIPTVNRSLSPSPLSASKCSSVGAGLQRAVWGCGGQGVISKGGLVDAASEKVRGTQRSSEHWRGCVCSEVEACCSLGCHLFC